MLLKLSNILPKLFLILGILIIIVTLGFDKYYSNKQDKQRDEFLKVVEDIRDERYIKEDDKIEVVDVSDDEEENKVNNVETVDGVIGLLSIPKINLKDIAIKVGVDKDTLRYAIGMFEESADVKNDFGNVSLASHRNFPANGFFLNLYKLSKGDDIYLKTLDETLHYVVYKEFIVKPEDTYVLNQTEDKELTLITCTKDRLHRRIIKAKIKE